jgi:hypothetical protein
MRRSSHRHTTNQRINELLFVNCQIRHETTGFEPTGHRTRAKDACVNIAPINPLSHRGSAFLLNQQKIEKQLFSKLAYKQFPFIKI